MTKVSMANNPRVSIIMSVHNGERFISISIESILNQTFHDFEFIIIDDGSTDRSREIIDRYAQSDPRIVVISREQKGLTKSLNEGLARARGSFIARQDADDVSLPRRLQTMVDFLSANPSVAAAGSWAEIIDENGRAVFTLRFPTAHERICWAMIGSTAIVHPSAVMRKESIAKFGSYNDDYTYAQDYELWTRWIRLGAQLANVPQVLVNYRRSRDQISTKLFGQQSRHADDCARAYIDFLVSEKLDPKEIAGIRQLVGPWPIDAAAFGAVPVTLRLLRLSRFRRHLRFAFRTRSQIASRIVTAVGEFGGGDRRRALSALMISMLISPTMFVERNWWTTLLKRLGPFHM